MRIKPFLRFTIFSIILMNAAVLKTISQENGKIEVKQIKAVQAIVIKADVPTSEISQKMGELYAKLFGYLGQNQLQPAGPPFAVYLSFDPQGNTVFETGIPVSKEIQGTDEYVFKVYPETKAVSTLYTGPYEKMEPVYTELEKYMKDNNLKEKGTAVEVYLTDPSVVTDPNNYQTIVYFPVE